MTSAVVELKRIVARLQGTDFSAVLARGSVSTFGVSVAAVGIGLALQVLLARLMGPEHYGYYRYAFNWILTLSSVTVLGFDRTLLRYLSVYRAQEAWAEHRGLARFSWLSALLASVLLSLGIGTTVAALGSRIAPPLAQAFWISCLILPMLTLCTLDRASLQSIRRVVFAQLPLEVIRPLGIAVLVLGATFLTNGVVTAPLAMTLDLVAVGVSFLSARLFMRARAGAPNAKAAYHIRPWFDMALPVLLTCILTILMKRVDVLMLGTQDTTVAGFYSAAQRLTQCVGFGLLAVNNMAASMIAELYAARRIAELQRILRVAALGILVTTVPIALVIGFFGYDILALFGPEFTMAYSPLLILLFGQVFDCLSGSVGLLLTMTGHHRQAAWSMGICAALNLLLNALLIPAFGAMGAAAATCTSTIVWNVGNAILVKRLVGVSPTVLCLLGWRKT